MISIDSHAREEMITYSATSNETHVVHNDMPLMRLRTVSTRTVQFSEIIRIETADVHRTCAVVLDDLVVRVERPSTDDVRHVVLPRLEQGERVLAHILPPHIADGARALAMDALGLVLANDDIADLAPSLDQEDGVLLACLLLTLADTACGKMKV
jgi:hypothetical protein